MHVSRGISVRGPRKRYNFILEHPFFTRFALITSRAPRDTSENIVTDLEVPLGDRVRCLAVNALSLIAE